MTDHRSVHQRFREVLTKVGPYRKDQKADIKDKFSYKYTDINSILEMLKPVLEEHRLCVYQPVTTRNEVTHVDTVIADLDSDDLIEFPGMGFSMVKDPQAAGGAITYFRRYGLVSLFALQADDDDGKSANEELERSRQPHPLSSRVQRVGNYIRGLDAEAKSDLEAWYNGKIKPSDLLQNEVLLTQLEEHLGLVST